MLEIVHSDMCGPINPTSSQKTWVYFLQQKSEAFLAFQNYKMAVEKEASCAIKVIRTNCGGEFNSRKFANFCEMHGIKRQLTTTYSPQ